jgi:hypothetical protein
MPFKKIIAVKIENHNEAHKIKMQSDWLSKQLVYTVTNSALEGYDGSNDAHLMSFISPAMTHATQEYTGELTTDVRTSEQLQYKATKHQDDVRGEYNNWDTECLYNKMFSSYEPCQLVKRRKNQRFKDHLCPLPQGADVSGVRVTLRLTVSQSVLASSPFWDSRPDFSLKWWTL